MCAKPGSPGWGRRREAFIDAASGLLSRPEYIGDGVFKRAGNVRATSVMTLLVPDLQSGDAVEITGRGAYTNIRTQRRHLPGPSTASE